MHVVQRDSFGIPETKEVYYVDSGDGEVAVGYAVCFDPAEDLTAAAGEFAELERFKVVTKPKTANLQFFAGIVTSVGKRTASGSDYSGWLTIAQPKWGEKVTALVKANATVASTVLTIEDDEWHLLADAAATADLFTRRSVGVAGETANTSVTAANKPVFGIL